MSHEVVKRICRNNIRVLRVRDRLACVPLSSRRGLAILNKKRGEEFDEGFQDAVAVTCRSHIGAFLSLPCKGYIQERTFPNILVRLPDIQMHILCSSMDGQEAQKEGPLADR